MNDKLNNIFSETDCLSEEMLMNYLSGNLSPAEKHKIERHLIDCELCSDAVEGLAEALQNKDISKITSEIRQKIQQRTDKRKPKIISLHPYRFHLAAAAAILFIVGMVFFFRNNIIMKELDSVSSEKIFAEKFSPPPSEKEEISATEQQAESDKNTADGFGAASIVALSDAEGKKTPSANKSAESGKDILAGEKTDLGENIPTQKPKPALSNIPVEEKVEEPFSHYKTTEAVPEGTVKSQSEIQKRDEDVLGDIVLLNKEISGDESRTDALKEETASKKGADKKEGVKKAVLSSTAAPKEQTSADAIVSADKTAQLEQENKQVVDDRTRAEEKSVGRNTGGKGEAVTFESGKITKGKSARKGKVATAQKVSGGYSETQITSPSPSTPQGMAGGVSALDSVSSGITTSTITTDGALLKYDKQDYAGAVNEFEQVLKQNPNDEKALFYSAVSYLSLGQTEKALTNFNKILQNKNSKYYDDAQWYSSLAYIKKQDIQNARKNLQEIQNRSSSRYQKQADETLKEINK